MQYAKCICNVRCNVRETLTLLGLGTRSRGSSCRTRGRGAIVILKLAGGVKLNW
jgi:hypothetical protein